MTEGDRRILEESTISGRCTRDSTEKRRISQEITEQ